MSVIKLDPAIHRFPKSTTLADSISISSYRDLQMLSGNKRYSRKEHRKGLMCVAVKIENNTHHTFTLTRENFHAYHGITQLQFVTPDKYAAKVKQCRGWYVFHLLWGPVAVLALKKFLLDDDPTSVYITGASIVSFHLFGFNAQKATNSNRTNLGYLRKYLIFDRVIQPGETAYGLVILKDPSPENPTFKIE